MIKVLGIKIVDRIKEAGLTQETLSKHSSVITTRLGFHEVTDSVCSREAYILLHLKDDKSESELLKKELEPLGGIIIREMIFSGKEKSVASKETEGAIEILGMLVERNHDVILSVQKLLTSYGCYIRTRLGVNETFFSEPAGLIILELTGDPDQRALLEKDLSGLKGVYVRKMIF
ncbi:MAG: hypothetical protein NT092_00220 [Bacteroidia bacterium]|nr:hypothetical protein [Bacteroidia bacterium]